MVKAPSSLRPSPQGSSPVFSSSLTCNYCKNPGHIKANCYRLVGFPAGYFDRPRPQDNKPKGKAAVTKPDHTNFAGPPHQGNNRQGLSEGSTIPSGLHVCRNEAGEGSPSSFDFDWGY
ncbi:uncharacterized protein LOC133719830 isoform X2 [Rosa rugosa]|uniref:uncharacterized protein LOC133719830 isoform X2 n=1 Tax=Rosa rugosa TaxID=74645 RepID=UPI002B40E6EF|nr:uncharacterized protein LOC133719830 isoform X2 [Rosa rugosa]